MGNRKTNRDICNLYKDKNQDELTLSYFEKELNYSDKNSSEWKKFKRGNAYLGVYDDFLVFSEALKNIEDSEAIKKYWRNVEDNSEHKDNMCLYRVLQAWKEPQKASFPIKIYNRDGKEIGEISQAPKDGEFELVYAEPKQESVKRSRKFNLEFLRDIDILNPDKNSGKEANQKWHLYVPYFAYSVVCKENFSWDDILKLRGDGSIICAPLRLWMIENAIAKNAEEQEVKDALEEIKEKLNQTDQSNATKELNDLIGKVFGDFIRGDM